jgi:transcriptional regulator with XRE-family HTH domain
VKYLAKNLKWLREQRHLKQSDIEGVIGFKSTTWNNYEKGVSKPGLDDMIKISKYFGYSETEILHKDLSVKKVTTTSRKTGKDIEGESMVSEGEVEYKKMCEIKDKIIEDKERIITAQQGQIDVLKLMAKQFEGKVQKTGSRKK